MNAGRLIPLLALLWSQVALAEIVWHGESDPASIHVPLEGQPFTLVLVDVKFDESAPAGNLDASASIVRAVLDELGFISPAVHAVHLRRGRQAANRGAPAGGRR